jgi:hypothetical protein
MIHSWWLWWAISIGVEKSEGNESVLSASLIVQFNATHSVMTCASAMSVQMHAMSVVAHLDWAIPAMVHSSYTGQP